jgi:hypothetical protein
MNWNFLEEAPFSFKNMLMNDLKHHGNKWYNIDGSVFLKTKRRRKTSMAKHLWQI